METHILRNACMTCGAAMSSEVSSPMQAIYYILLLRPSPFLGVLDFYVLVPFSKLIQRRYQVADLTLRDRLGSGNFGQVMFWLLQVHTPTVSLFVIYRDLRPL